MLRRAQTQKEQVWGLNRVIFPLAGFTLKQVLDYYGQIAPYLLPHLKSHPVTLKRYPDEAGGEFFYEKDAPGLTPSWVKTFGVWRRSGESQIHYILINDRRTLLWAASVGTLEIHPFLAKAPDISRPAAMVFDLDPGPPADILQCAEVAELLRELLDRLQLRSWVKVSGSKGLQVYVPLNTPVSYGVTQALARSLAEALHQEHRGLVVSSMEREQRKGKVFIDWSQNADYKTTVAVYSLRAKRRHPYISLPVKWEELRQARDQRDAKSLFFSPEAALERVRRLGDLFAPVLELEQRVPESFVRQLGRTEHAAPPRRDAGRSSERVLQLPRASAQGGRRRFVLQADQSAQKLTLEMHGILKAWELPQGVPRKTGQAVPAREVAAPERFPGEEPLDTGTSELIEGKYGKGYLDLFFSGKEVNGEFVLRADAQPGMWILQKRSQPGEGLERVHARSFGAEAPRDDAVLKVVRSQESGVRKSGAGKKNGAGVQLKTGENERLPEAAPSFIKPMECKLVGALPEGAQWVYELKLDGYRVIAVKKGKAAQLLSRYGNSLTQRFPGIASALQKSLLGDAVLDGEIVALDQQGRPSFQELQNSGSTRQPTVYYVFDVLNYGGRDLQALPLERRKAFLEEIAKRFIEPVRPAAVLNAELATLLEEIRRRGLEGLVAKRRDAIYEAGKRSGAWRKYRINQREEFVIGGYLPGRNFLDAVLVGRFKGSQLYFVKKVRNGFVRRTREQVLRAIERLRVRECPFVNLPEAADRRGAVTVDEMKRYAWVKPEVRCEVDFEEWTRGGRLRHAAFRQLV